MAGYGNRTAPDYTPEDLEAQHTTTRLGLVDSHTPYHNPHEKHGSGITGGAGFGTYIFLPPSLLTQYLLPPSISNPP